MAYTCAPSPPSSRKKPASHRESSSTCLNPSATDKDPP
jgi:hypothetical protein